MPTLERWYYAFRKRGLAGLTPAPRRDQGREQDVSPQLRELLCDIRLEPPSASAALILRTLVAGRVAQRHLVQILLPEKAAHGGGGNGALLHAPIGSRPRLRWQAARPMALWQGRLPRPGAAARLRRWPSTSRITRPSTKVRGNSYQPPTPCQVSSAASSSQSWWCSSR
ncbi:helix-turn-helix domain-containing protein [Pyxidicoccus caerfyrddinensis]|uniref:helix-turn-helix domain-containing protein n=1 Tax=Pyxidicoccus caerfyrddinensis TaxID=2709663 RepID=UPI003B833723